LQLVHAQQRRADALHAALGHIHGHDRVGVDIVEVLVGQRLLQLLDAHHTAQIALGLAFRLGLAEALAGGGGLLGRGILAGCVLGIGAGRVCRRVLGLALGLVLGQIIGRVLGLVLRQILGQILGRLIFIVVTLEQCHGDQILYLVRM